MQNYAGGNQERCNGYRNAIHFRSYEVRSGCPVLLYLARQLMIESREWSMHDQRAKGPGCDMGATSVRKR